MPKLKKPTKKTKAEEEIDPKKLTGSAASSAAALAWLARINASKHYTGKAQICMANEVRTPYLLRRPTGVLSLDLALGGGFPAGGEIEVHGEESAGKTYLVYHTAGEVQKIYGDQAAILIFSTEIRPDKGFARRAGFHIGYSEAEVAEYSLIRVSNGLLEFTDEERVDLLSQTGTIVYISAATADIGLDAVVEAIEENIFQLVIIESMGAFLTKDASEDDVGERRYAGSSVIVTNFQNKVYPKLVMDRPDGTMNETTIIGINQARAVMDGGKYAPKTKAAAGAFAWKHGQMASIHLAKGASIRPDEKSPVIGREIRWDVMKGKIGTHDGLRGTYNFYHMQGSDPIFWKTVQTCDVGGVDINEDLISTAKSLGVIKMAGAWLNWEVEGVTIKAQGDSNFVGKLEENPELFVQLRHDCVKASGISVRYA